MEGNSEQSGGIDTGKNTNSRQKLEKTSKNVVATFLGGKTLNQLTY